MPGQPCHFSPDFSIVIHTFISSLQSYSVGIHQRPGDLEVNVCKTKALTNMRSATKGITTGITAPIELSLDGCVEYLAVDEILEITPTKMRMAKNPSMAGSKKKGKK